MTADGKMCLSLNGGSSHLDATSMTFTYGDPVDLGADDVGLNDRTIISFASSISEPYATLGLATGIQLVVQTSDDRLFASSDVLFTRTLPVHKLQMPHRIEPLSEFRVRRSGCKRYLRLGARSMNAAATAGSIYAAVVIGWNEGYQIQDDKDHAMSLVVGGGGKPRWPSGGHYVAVGDSTTVGHQDGDPTAYTDHVVAPWTVDNLGIGATTTEHWLLGTSGTAAALDGVSTTPDVVSIMLGTNDIVQDPIVSKTSYKNNLIGLILGNILVRWPNAEILLIEPVPLLGRSSLMHQTFLEYNNALDELHAQFGLKLPVLKTQTGMTLPTGWTVDGIHQVEVGNAMIGAALFEIVSA